MEARILRALAVLVVLALAGLTLLIAVRGRALGDGRSIDAPQISAQERAAAATFDPSVPAIDRAWIEAAVAAARPEAQRLIAEVDGLVRFQVHRGDPLGVTRSEVSALRASFVVSFDIASLDGARAQDRAVTVLHEYGHVIDLAIVPQELGDRLETAIPRSGGCADHGGVLVGSCAEPAERFADTFAKWALRGRVSAVGAGYQVPDPPSLEGWGAPLVALSNQLATPR